MSSRSCKPFCVFSAWAVIALLTVPVLAPAAEPKVFFQENFQNYRDVAPLCTSDLGIEIGNDPIWTQSAEANCRMKSSGLIFKEFVPAPNARPSVEQYEVMFKFRFHSDAERKFEVRVRQSQGGKMGEIALTIFATGVSVTGHGISASVSGQAALRLEIPNHQWRWATVRVQDGTLSVFVDENRVLKPVLKTALPAGQFDGVNFYGFKDCPFSITNVVVREPGPLPDHSVTRMLPATPLEDLSTYKTGAEQSEVTVPANEVFGATVKTGLEKNAVKLSVNWADGKKSEVTFTVAAIQGERKIKKDGKDVVERYPLPDAVIEVRGIANPKAQLNYHVRPLLRRYHTSYSFTDAYHDIIRDWELLPKASEHPVKVECHRVTDGLHVYLNGRFAGMMHGGGVSSIVFTLAPGAALKDVVSRAAGYEPSRYLPLDVAALRKAKAFATAKTSTGAGLENIEGVPLQVASPDYSADIGLTREGQGNWALEVDEYLARSPFDGLLTEVHFTVPSAVYTKAWVLCAVDPDPRKDPVLTTRLAHYVESGVGNNTLADTVIALPRGEDEPRPGVRKVGSVSLKDGTEVPLHLVEVELKSGQIVDLLMRKPVLNFEFFGKPWENFEQLDNTSKPDPRSTSAVQVFGVTLEKSPVGLEFIQAQPANIFHNDETPETTAVVRSFAPARGKLAWSIVNAEGKVVGTSSAEYRFDEAGKEQQIHIPLKTGESGWFELRVALLDEAGNKLLEHPARFAILGKDERKARYESPYGIWWFDGTHGTPAALEFGGSVMFKAGIRQVAWTSHKEKAMEKWLLTKDQVNMPFKFDDLKNPDAAMKRAEESMRKYLADYPHLREVLVFHESGPGNDLPLELIGIKPTLSDARIAREKRYADLFNLAGQFFREKFPQLKLVVGNNSCSQACIAAIFRHGGKPEYMDYIGIEAPAQVYIPEKLQEWGLQGLNIAKDTAKILTGKDIPATGCYEFTYRSERDMGEQQQAEWYTRDVLISLANNFTLIGPGILFDCSNAYYNGLWGGSGLLQRGPYGYPKKAYVAYATLTNVLDQVKFRRQIPTGSTTVYALEFERADGKHAAALWAARGTAEFAIQFTSDTPLRIVDMYGRSREVQTSDARVAVSGGTSPTYILAEKPVAGVTVSARAFPKDDARAKLARVAAAVDHEGQITLTADNTLDTPKVFPLQTPIRQRGVFEVRSVNDEQRGACVELELKTEAPKELSKYITEYATLKFKQPAKVTGDPAALGVWVKGNSNWGRVLFEIEDAEGETWRSIGTGGWGCDVLDWPGNISVNFDGWNFIALPLRDTRLFNDHSPGPVSEQWVSDGGNKKIDLPIKVTGLIVEMNRQSLDLLDFKAPKPVIRLKDVSGIYEPSTPAK
ncbi:MAG TPA: hypothetical protein VEK08_09215 [Planctomycetota bacterium]|nr:hypothetical protein [Planctomycetota bacterium]